MRTSATGAEEGFTLVELLVVLAIIGLSGAAVALALPDPRGDLRAEAERFAARAHAAQDAAVIEARDMVLRVTDAGYAFERREDGQWRLVTEKAFRPEAWPEGVHALVGAAGRGHTIFDTTGEAEPLEVTLVRDDARILVRIGGDGSIHVE